MDGYSALMQHGEAQLKPDFKEAEAQCLRAAGQQALRRDANERVFALRGGASFTQYVCECALKSCEVAVGLTPLEYREVRREPTYFLVACGHWTSFFERAVFETDRYLVVEKVGEAALLARESMHDSRSPAMR